MDIAFYTAAVGVEQQQMRLNVHSNNIANVNNYGFHPRRTSFSTLLSNQLRGTDEDYRRHVGARLEATGGDFWDTRNGVNLATTGRALDYAIEGSGFFALQDPATGEITYSRDGSFTISSLVVTDRERAVLTEEEEEALLAAQEEAVFMGEEPPEWPMEEIQRSHWYLSDGLGRFVLSTQGEKILVEDPMYQEMGFPLPVGVFDFPNHNGMLNAGDNRYEPVEKNGNVSLRPDAKVLQGALERSSTDLAYEFAKVIETQRTFTFLMKMVQTADEVAATVNGLR